MCVCAIFESNHFSSHKTDRVRPLCVSREVYFRLLPELYDYEPIELCVSPIPINLCRALCIYIYIYTYTYVYIYGGHVFTSHIHILLLSNVVSHLRARTTQTTSKVNSYISTPGGLSIYVSVCLLM